MAELKEEWAENTPDVSTRICSQVPDVSIGAEVWGCTLNAANFVYY